MGLLVIQSRCRAGRNVPHAARTGAVPKAGLRSALIESQARTAALIRCGNQHAVRMTHSIDMTAELVRSNRLFSGVPYAYAATVAETGLIVTAGACPLDVQGRVVAPGDVAAQTRQAFGNLRITLEECGAELRDVLKTTIYVSSGNRDDLVVAWNEVARSFGDYDPPSTLLGVAVLGYPDQLVEIEAIAVVTRR